MENKTQLVEKNVMKALGEPFSTQCRDSNARKTDAVSHNTSEQ